MTEPADNLAAAISVWPKGALSQIPGYKPGKPAPEIPGLPTHKLSSNELAYGPLPSVQTALREEITKINRYPDMGCTALTASLAGQLNVPAECLSFGTGSVAVLQSLVQAMCEPEDEVVYAWRSFEAYPIVVALAGAKGVPVPLTASAAHDLPAMAAAITSRTRVVLLCTPNNPTGPAITNAEFAEFMAAVPPHVLVVIDEAYFEFAPAGANVDSLAAFTKWPNVAVLRTFSKAHGLAGLRIGYAVSRPPISQGIAKQATPFGVTNLAQVAALASLNAEEELQERVDEVIASRAKLLPQVRKMFAQAGVKVPVATGNFFWLELGAQTTAFAEHAAASGLVVRPFAGEGVRITIAEPEANKRLLTVVRSFVNSLSA